MHPGPGARAALEAALRCRNAILLHASHEDAFRHELLGDAIILSEAQDRAARRDADVGDAPFSMEAGGPAKGMSSTDDTKGAGSNSLSARVSMTAQEAYQAAVRWDLNSARSDA
jgi:hypothetical protein